MVLSLQDPQQELKIHIFKYVRLSDIYHPATCRHNRNVHSIISSHT